MPGQTVDTDQQLGVQCKSRTPSMEGRAIARPNPAVRMVSGASFNDVPGRTAGPPGPFNGGPGNCPAKPERDRGSSQHGRHIVPSMEGRAIARPNPAARRP